LVEGGPKKKKKIRSGVCDVFVDLVGQDEAVENASAGGLGGARVCW